MFKAQTTVALTALVALSACFSGQTDNPDIDRGFDAHPLSAMRPSLWVDPTGCEHWFLDDGVEGYLSNRIRRNGTPVCRIDEEAAPPEEIVQTVVATPEQPVELNIELAADAFFDVDSSLIKEEGLPQLDAYFIFLQQEGIRRVVVEGHTDSDASAEYNEALSFRRARAVGFYAAQYGISAIPVGKGESEPAVPNDSIENKARNRRVEIFAIQNDAAAPPISG
ncbi:MAG: OmpA family protein [Pseudomonadota bacterium]